MTVYADGPTRVLRFSDEPNIEAGEAMHNVLVFAARLQQVENELALVNSKFLRLHGPSGIAGLDLYGRSTQLQSPSLPKSGSALQQRSESGKSHQGPRIRHAPVPCLLRYPLSRTTTLS